MHSDAVLSGSHSAAAAAAGSHWMTLRLPLVFRSTANVLERLLSCRPEAYDCITNKMFKTQNVDNMRHILKNPLQVFTGRLNLIFNLSNNLRLIDWHPPCMHPFSVPASCWSQGFRRLLKPPLTVIGWTKASWHPGQVNNSSHGHTETNKEEHPFTLTHTNAPMDNRPWVPNWPHTQVFGLCEPEKRTENQRRYRENTNTAARYQWSKKTVPDVWRRQKSTTPCKATYLMPQIRFFLRGGLVFFFFFF